MTNYITTQFRGRGVRCGTVFYLHCRDFELVSFSWEAVRESGAAIDCNTLTHGLTSVRCKVNSEL